MVVVVVQCASRRKSARHFGRDDDDTAHRRNIRKLSTPHQHDLTVVVMVTRGSSVVALLRFFCASHSLVLCVCGSREIRNACALVGASSGAPSAAFDRMYGWLACTRIGQGREQLLFCRLLVLMLLWCARRCLFVCVARAHGGHLPAVESTTAGSWRFDTVADGGIGCIVNV